MLKIQQGKKIIMFTYLVLMFAYPCGGGGGGGGGGEGRGLGGWKGGLKHSLLASSLLLCIPKIMGGPALELLN